MLANSKTRSEGPKSYSWEAKQKQPDQLHCTKCLKQNKKMCLLQ